MTQMMACFQQMIALKSNRRAVTALEYGLIAALIAGVIIAAVSALGTDISTTFTTLGTSISNANGLNTK